MRNRTMWSGAAVAAIAVATGGAIAAAATPSTTTPTSTTVATTPTSPAPSPTTPAGSTPASTPAPPTTPSSTASAQPVVVVLRNQIPSLPATRGALSRRRTAVHQAQQPVLSSLSAARATDVQSYTAVNAVSATVSPAEAARLAANPAVAQVVPDRPFHPATPTVASSATNAASTLPGSCPADGKVQLEPEGLDAIHADSDTPGAKTARSLGYTGAGVSVGFIADGLDINNPEFVRKNGQHVFTDYEDFSGEGTAGPTGGAEAFLDAGSIAAQGNTTYDVSNYLATPLASPCKIRIEGVAPGVSLVGLSIFGDEDAGFESSFLDAIDYAVTVSHVNVLNESLGANDYPDDAASQDIAKAANDAAVAAGVTVVVSSGDAGPSNTIGTPASDPNVLDVGASTTYRIDAQVGITNQLPGVSGWISNNIASLSSSGFTQSGSTIDLVAPGDAGWAPCSTNVTQYSECTNVAGNPSPIEAVGGTSESAPLTAGVAALVIQAYAKVHGGTKPTPAVVEQILRSSADDLSAPAEQQGAGIVDAYRAVLLAQRYGIPAASLSPSDVLSPATFTTAVSQFNEVGAPNAPETMKEKVTNTGRNAQVLSLSTRAIGAYTSVGSGSVALNDPSKQVTQGDGTPLDYQSISFTVPAGQDRLKAQIGFQQNFTSLLLVDPSGRIAGQSSNQGPAGYGEAEVTSPAAGTWTAYVYGPAFDLPVVFDASVATFTTFGTVSPSVVVLAAGQSSTVTVNETTPASPGDAAGSLQIRPLVGNGNTTSVPITLRSLAASGSTTFSGALSGGVGRAGNVGQTNYYQVDVPAGQPVLNASVSLAYDRLNPYSLFLVDPQGNMQAYSTDAVLQRYADGSSYAQNQVSANAHVLSPMAGRWTIIVEFAPFVSGLQTSQPYSVHLDETPAQVSAPDLPTSPDTTLLHGQLDTVNLTVTNTGPAAEAYFVDARLATTTRLALQNQADVTTKVPLSLGHLDPIPGFVIPTNTTHLLAEASTTGSTPIEFDFSPINGDPDVAGIAVDDNYASGEYFGNPVPAGAWSLAPDVIGPFGAGAVAPEPVSVAVTATTNAFDPQVTTDGGDMWLLSTNRSYKYNTVIVQPGATATIPVTITPKGPSGSVVRGTLYLDDESWRNFLGGAPNGSQVAALPYAYTIQ